ncbi:MAG: RNA-binding protein, partial [Kutzneria sp.]|nr:RNA-binding protein [Kutzneria sp.]
MSTSAAPAGQGHEPELSAVDGQGDQSTVDWNALPDAVRSRLAEIGAEAVGALPLADIPQQVRVIARFAPAKRAKHGGGALVAGLRDVPAFRAAVVDWCQEHRPSVLDTTASEPVVA